MIKSIDLTYSQDNTKIYIIFSVPEMLANVTVEVNRQQDFNLHKTIEHFKNLSNIQKYLNSG